MRAVTGFVMLAACASVALAQDGGSTPPPEHGSEHGSERVLQLHVADVGRLALRNSPDFHALRLNPDIARTRIEEALGEFDPLFAARATGGQSRSHVFFDPAGFAPGAATRFQEDETFRGGASLSSVEEWGGRWEVGYDATSVGRSGASSINSLSPRYEGALSLGYSHPLLRNAGRAVRLSRTNEARALTEDAERRLQRAAELTVADAETVYWDLVRARADLEVRVKSVEVAKELLDVAQARLDARRGLPVDVAEAVAGLARREVDRIEAETQVSNLSDQLRALVAPFIGENPDLELSIVPLDEPAAGEIAMPARPDVDDLRAALARRTDVTAAQAIVEAAEQAELRARSEEQYEVNAIASGALRGLGSGFSESSEQIRDRDARVWEVGLEVVVPLGNLAAEARLLRAERETQRARRELTALQNGVAVELRIATRETASAAERIAAASQARQAATEQLEAEQARLENGRSTPFRVLEVEEELAEARSAEIRARVDYESSRVRLESAGGSLLESRGLLTLPESAVEAAAR